VHCASVVEQMELIFENRVYRQPQLYMEGCL